ncbi:uncharacterized protein CC84DRAFT_407432 [Paraphaeosphaeria sporulosa]|uniref:Uncharacterized protein n=1 Tax=Paraphaeosphaeria sporulosa TaxID=1460663 RepID=A0A177BXR8_9PLEO|nr:uncharacterized protein CC84DRAFT_407432 [Paraphaeosphaeria sporulosa]OAF99501.1 hypothetical protein CC84DRAFT_407432 [Paraphaeosphaeria sporulosa]
MPLSMITVEYDQSMKSKCVQSGSSAYTSRHATFQGCSAPYDLNYKSGPIKSLHRFPLKRGRSKPDPCTMGCPFVQRMGEHKDESVNVYRSTYVPILHTKPRMSALYAMPFFLFLFFPRTRRPDSYFWHISAAIREHGTHNSDPDAATECRLRLSQVYSPPRNPGHASSTDSGCSVLQDVLVAIAATSDWTE